MIRIELRPLAVLCAALMLFAVPVASAQAVLIPGDNHLNAQTVVLNGSKTIKDVHSATLQDGIVEVTTCDGDSDLTHSVWFTFTMPSGGIVDIDTAGTFYSTDEYVTNSVVVSVYELTGLTQSHVVCDEGLGPRLIGQELAEGIYRIRVATETDFPILSPSQARVSVRLRRLYQLLDDGEFDDEPLGTVWKTKNAGNPPLITRVCSPCHVRFDGVAGGTIKQTLPLPPANIKIKTGDFLVLTGMFNDTPPTPVDAKFTIKVIYSDGTPTTKLSVMRTFSYSNTDSALTVGFFDAEIESKAVKKVTVSITSPAVSDMYALHAVNLEMVAGGTVRAKGVPPLPASP